MDISKSFVVKTIKNDKTKDTELMVATTADTIVLSLKDNDKTIEIANVDNINKFVKFLVECRNHIKSFGSTVSISLTEYDYCILKPLKHIQENWQDYEVKEELINSLVLSANDWKVYNPYPQMVVSATFFDNAKSIISEVVERHGEYCSDILPYSKLVLEHIAKRDKKCR